ncbi:MAG: carboxypeptidase-like regulatory domain-containing protein [Bryobacteraceae bacterium]|nr:carboxypeptidase-like regulatory domain-containing protein [Bryobacteraceae bacterium]
MNKSPFLWLALLLGTASGAAVGAVVEGKVVDNRTGVPLARSRVLLMPVRSTAPQISAYADARGAFRMEAPAGVYALGAERPGYAFTWYGQRVWNGRGTPIVLDQDGRFSAEIRLRRLGAISGEIRDENGAGLWDFPVAVYRDTRPLQLAAQGKSDDRGVFRIAGLSPGRYLVRTGYQELGHEGGYLPTFYGGSIAAESAQSIEVQLDADVEGLVLTPQTGHLLRLKGKVTFPGSNVVRLYGDVEALSSVVDNAGHFSFERLAPGSYYLAAESKISGEYLTAYQRLWLKSDLEDLQLEGAPAPLLQLRCRAAGGRPSGALPGSVSLIRIVPAGESRAEQVRCGSSVSLPPGTWQLRVSTPAGFYLQVLTLHGHPLNSPELEALPGERLELEAAFSDKPAAVEGKLVDANQQPVPDAAIYLRPADSSLQQRLTAAPSARTGADGSFLIRGLPPGRYLAAVSLDGGSEDEIDWNSPLLRTVEVEEGGKASITLSP